MTIMGRVLKGFYEKEGKKYPQLVLDIRTITVKKKFTLDLNKMKYPTGKLDEIKKGCEKLPDYSIWYNINNRGEGLPKVCMGHINNMKSKEGKDYKQGFIYDPFVQKEPIYFTLHSVDEDRKSEENHLYNVLSFINT